MNPAASDLPPAQPDPVIFVLTQNRLRRFLAVVRGALLVLTIAYAGTLLVLLAALEWVGERFWPFGVMLYAPPHLVLLPLAVLTPLCLLFRWRLCWWHLGCAVFVFFFYMTFRFSSPPARAEGEVSIVTFNQGQSSHSEFLAFVLAHQPDVVLLQDARWRAATIKTQFPDRFVATEGEFLLLSKFPIQRSALLTEPRGDGRPVAARFEIMVNEHPTALYSVHLPTPRHQLNRFVGGRRLVAHLLGLKNYSAVYGDYRKWLDERLQTARDLAAVFAGEKQPYLVGGDFNTPDHGYIYHLFAGEMTDAFAKTGRGWGMTFPGMSSQLFTLYGPWLRIDYLFAGNGWRPVDCQVQGKGRSQHRAVFARFVPRAGKS